VSRGLGDKKKAGGTVPAFRYERTGSYHAVSGDTREARYQRLFLVRVDPRLFDDAEPRVAEELILVPIAGWRLSAPRRPVVTLRLKFIALKGSLLLPESFASAGDSIVPVVPRLGALRFFVTFGRNWVVIPLWMKPPVDMVFLQAWPASFRSMRALPYRPPAPPEPVKMGL